ncbi:MAG: hypothetical protein ACI39F_00035 [Acutalibacteraceae bacterium]
MPFFVVFLVVWGIYEFISSITYKKIPDTKKPPNVKQHNYDECFKHDLMTNDDIKNFNNHDSNNFMDGI